MFNVQCSVGGGRIIHAVFRNQFPNGGANLPGSRDDLRMCSASNYSAHSNTLNTYLPAGRRPPFRKLVLENSIVKDPKVRPISAWVGAIAQAQDIVRKINLSAEGAAHLDAATVVAAPFCSTSRAAHYT